MNYHNITKDDMLNGDGLRVVLWVAGCEHHCEHCQNPITWNPEGGILFDDKAKEELFEALSKKHISGVTFSGGDPFHGNNILTITELAKEIKREFLGRKSIWLYTGYTYDQVKEKEIMKYIDVLVDGKFNLDLLDVKYPWAGSTNQRVIDVQQTRQKGKVVLHGNS